MSTLFENQAPRPLADRLRPQQPRRGGRPGPSARAGRADRADGGEPAALLDDPVGAAGLRQDHDRAAAGARHRPSFRAAVGGVFRGRRSAQGVRRARESGARWASGTLLFVDEIHRFNRAQQDAFLPVVEDGTVILVGATTENPSFELNGALLSRAQVFVLRRLGDDDSRNPAAARRGRVSARMLPLTEDAPHCAAGDGRRRRPLPAQPGRGDRARCRPAPALGPAAARRDSCSAARRFTTRRRKAITT